MKSPALSRSTRGLLLVALAGIATQAAAFQPLITDDTGTQGQGGNQIEFSYNRDREKSAGERETTQSLPVTYTRGLTETLDIFAATNFVRYSTPANHTSGLSNSSVGVKWRFYENKESKTSFALKPELIFPVSSSRETAGLGNGKLSGKLTFIATQEVPFGAVHFNAGLGQDRFSDTDANPDSHNRRVSIAPVWDVSEKWKLAIDGGLELTRAGGQTVRSRFLGIGSIYSPDKNLDLAVGVFRNTDNDTPGSATLSATAGVTWRFQ